MTATATIRSFVTLAVIALLGALAWALEPVAPQKDKQRITTSQIKKLKLSSPVRFDSAKAELQPDIMPLLSKLLDHLLYMENTVSVEGRSENNPIQGYDGSNTREYITNPMMAFAVTGDSVMERRTVVEDYNCENCHVNISLHGNNRKSHDYCNTCHRPEFIAVLEPQESVHQKWMIHKIHRGADLENGYVVVRSRGTFDFSDIHYVGDLRNCEKCHVDDSYQLPMVDDLLATITPQNWWSPTAPIGATCLSCHDGDAASAHVFSNTTFFGEACDSCHAEGKDYSVDRVHAR